MYFMSISTYYLHLPNNTFVKKAVIDIILLWKLLFLRLTWHILQFMVDIGTYALFNTYNYCQLLVFYTDITQHLQGSRLKIITDLWIIHIFVINKYTLMANIITILKKTKIISQFIEPKSRRKNE